jgi:hypothetical protein
MTKARVIVTTRCNRNCENCCNKEEVFNNHKVITDVRDLLSYDEIMITGGEPMLIPGEVIHLLIELREHFKYQKPIYLYTAYYNHSTLFGYYRQIFRYLDGLQYTVHNEATDREIIELRQMSDLVRLFGNGNSSLRLSIDSRLYDRYDFSNIDFSGWSVVRKMKWMLNCPLPKGEELIIYNLDKHCDGGN